MKDRHITPREGGWRGHYFASSLLSWLSKSIVQKLQDLSFSLARQFEITETPKIMLEPGDDQVFHFLFCALGVWKPSFYAQPSFCQLQ